MRWRDVHGDDDAEPLVSLVCAADRPRALPVLLACLRAQTLEAWELLVLDQGDGACAALARATGDQRVRAFHVERVGDWGQTVKVQAAKDRARADVLGFPADDAYYAPPFLERMLTAVRGGAGLAVCDWVYDLAGYVAWTAQPTVGRVDVGGFLVTRAAFNAAGWTDRGHEGDGHFVAAVLAAGFPWVRVPGVLYMKN